MHTTFGMAEERTFKVQAERTGSRRLARQVAGLGQPTQSFQGGVHRGGDGARAVAGNAIGGEVALEASESVAIEIHQVVASSTMNMNVDKSGCENAIPKFDEVGTSGYFRVIPGTDGEDTPVFDNDDGMVNGLQRSEGGTSCDGNLQGSPGKRKIVNGRCGALIGNAPI